MTGDNNTKNFNRQWLQSDMTKNNSLYILFSKKWVLSNHKDISKNSLLWINQWMLKISEQPAKIKDLNLVRIIITNIKMIMMMMMMINMLMVVKVTLLVVVWAHKSNLK